MPTKSVSAVYTCCIPKNLSALDRIIELDRLVFGKHALLPPAAAREIYFARPEVYCGVFGPEGSVLAYMDVYPLRESSGSEFIRGRISEADISARMILARNENHDGCCIYIGALASARPLDHETSALLVSSLLRWRTKQFTQMSANHARIVMTAATEAGRALIERTQAVKLSSAAERKDGLDLFGLTVDLKSAERLIDTLYPIDTDQLAKVTLDFTLPDLSKGKGT